ncbi:OmpH family outer membrane protein [Candidatus Aerophobetes bacterium]|uniref:OmpH family outer membrane protein n=1 Tax=Aerophobetes bacterium TaxID=2030807 RepID=A0A523UTW1_UNCAE|nr:MAG: OmpH family outer membrane protein [Candidatus Aerophobetes bacterium]
MRGKEVGALLLAAFLVTLFLGYTSGGAVAELVPKIGFVDVQKVFGDYQKTKDIMVRLKIGFEEEWAAMAEKRKLLERTRKALEEKLIQIEEKTKEIQEKVKELGKLEEELALQEALLTPYAKEEKLAQIQLLSQDIQRLGKERQELEKEGQVGEIQLRALEEEIRSFSDTLEAEKQEEEFRYSEEISEDILSTIKSIAEKGGYRLVFDKGALLYTTPEAEFDLTEEVLFRLNQNYQLGQ